MISKDSSLTVAGVTEQLSYTILPFSHVHPGAHLTLRHIVSKNRILSPVFDLTKEQSASSGELPLLLENLSTNISLNEGDDLFLSIAAYGSEPLSYQWKKDNVDIVDATSPVYQKLNVLGSDEAVYKCVVTNAYGSVVSHECEVTVVIVVTEYTVNFIAGAGGSINGDIEQVVAEGGNCTAVEAVADSGYQFVDWTGDAASSDNPLTVQNVVADMEITANFELTPVGPNMNVLDYYYSQMNENN
jgi:uncharacterized repeat protein (TIGR02543 family)